MADLRELVQDYSDEQLLRSYSERSEYTDEAVLIFEEEIERRCLNITAAVAQKAQEAAAEIASTTANAAVKNLKREEFEPLDCWFSKADVLTANSILHDSDIPYIVEECENIDSAAGASNSESADDTGAHGAFSILIYRDALEKARALVAEHFDAGPGGAYVFREEANAGRVKAFSFSDIKFSDAAARELLDVDFSEREKSSLIYLAGLLLDEADRMEEEQGRVVFFYDSLEPLIEKLNGSARLTRPDLLTIIELCQVYCEDPRYDQTLNQTATSIISFLLGY